VLGYPDGALAAIGEARAMGDRLAHPGTTIIRLCSTSWVHCHRGDLAEARRCAEEAVALATSHGFASYIDDGRVILACVQAREGGGTDAVEPLYQRLRSAGPGRAAWRDVLCFTALARVAGDRGDADLGLAILDAIPMHMRGTFFAAEQERTRGELLRHRGDGAGAERCFRRAIESAQARGERSLELRAAISLARVLAAAGRRKDARQALDAAYSWFTEGFDTADLRAARSLLDELRRGR
jgi:tetratricopeptide (TPR) repeat protein